MQAINVFKNQILSMDGTGHPEPVQFGDELDKCFKWALGTRPESHYFKGSLEIQDKVFYQTFEQFKIGA